MFTKTNTAPDAPLEAEPADTPASALASEAGPAPALLILAAGMGSRYGGLKQVDALGPTGEKVLDYSVYDALAAGFGKIVFVIRRQIETEFRAAIGARFETLCDVRYVFQELDSLPVGFAPPAKRVKPWGTGHAVAVAAHAIAEPFAVINADDFYGRSGFDSLANYLRSTDADGKRFALVGFVLRKTLSAFGSVSRGVCTCTDGRLQRIVELTRISPVGDGAVNLRDDGSGQPLSGDELVSLNMWGFTPVLFDALETTFRRFLNASGDDPTAEFYLPAAIDAMIANGEATVRVLASDDHWFGITYREDKPAVAAGIRRLVERGVYPSPLFPTRKG